MTRVALLGFGTVGSAVAHRLTHDFHRPDLQLTHIFDRRAAEKAARAVLPHRQAVVWTSRIDDILASDADVVIEAIGGVEPAASWIREALRAGKSVVTANKQIVARHGAALWRLADRQGRQFRFEAAVGGAMPIVRAIGDGLAGDRITRIAAILNGTTNVVLSRMDAGCSLAVALEEAQANGYAEADPAADLDGADACAKLAILCALAFGVRVDPDAIASRPVSSLSACDFERAKRRGCTLRQLACAEFDAAADALTAWVAPVPVPSSSFFGRAVGPQNAALITCEHSGEIGIFGAGAGGRPTSAAVLSDLVAIGRDRAAIVPPPHLSSSYTFHPSDFAYREAL